MDHINYRGKNIIKISLKFYKQNYYQRENGVNMFAVLFLILPVPLSRKYTIFNIFTNYLIISHILK